MSYQPAVSTHTETSVCCWMNPSLTSNSLKLPLHGQREGTAEIAKPQGNADHRFSFGHMGENARAEVEQQAGRRQVARRSPPSKAANTNHRGGFLHRLQTL